MAVSLVEYQNQIWQTPPNSESKNCEIVTCLPYLPSIVITCL